MRNEDGCYIFNTSETEIEEKGNKMDFFFKEN